MSVTQLPAWQALVAHKEKMKNLHMRDLFNSNPERFHRFSIRFEDLLFDYSKTVLQKKPCLSCFSSPGRRAA